MFSLPISVVARFEHRAMAHCTAFEARARSKGAALHDHQHGELMSPPSQRAYAFSRRTAGDSRPGGFGKSEGPSGGGVVPDVATATRIHTRAQRPATKFTKLAPKL